MFIQMLVLVFDCEDCTLVVECYINTSMDDDIKSLNDSLNQFSQATNKCMSKLVSYWIIHSTILFKSSDSFRLKTWLLRELINHLLIFKQIRYFFIIIL